MIYHNPQVAMRSPPSARRLGTSCAVLSLLGLLIATPAVAGLGENVSLVTRDATRLGATTPVRTPMAGYERHAFAAGTSTQVREYANANGTVFAVAFETRTLPDLKLLLGTRHDAYVRALHPGPSTHKVNTVTTPDVVVTIVKLPRGFAGTAHAPGLVPAGVDLRTLR
jgi:Protein of unknown function (DUF2844)